MLNSPNIHLHIVQSVYGVCNSDCNGIQETSLSGRILLAFCLFKQREHVWFRKKKQNVKNAIQARVFFNFPFKIS